MKAIVHFKSGRDFAINNINSIRFYNRVPALAEETRVFSSFCIFPDRKYVFLGDKILCVNGSEIEYATFE